jgi:hypothetical protein
VLVGGLVLGLVVFRFVFGVLPLFAQSLLDKLDVVELEGVVDVVDVLELPLIVEEVGLDDELIVDGELD